MNLENGSIINQYKIISSIGKGGMGEVLFDGESLLNPLRSDPRDKESAETDGFARMNLNEDSCRFK